MPDETKDTQPLLKDILEEMRSGFALVHEDLQQGFERMDARLDGILKTLKIYGIHIGNIDKQLGRITAESDLIDERVSKLEGSSGIQ